MRRFDSKRTVVLILASRGSFLHTIYTFICRVMGPMRIRVCACVSKTLTLAGITLLIWACGNTARQTTELHGASRGRISVYTLPHTEYNSLQG